jgi:hypothetical protein
VTLAAAVAAFGARATAKLSDPAARGQPEDQLRAPFEALLADMAELCLIPREQVTSIGETALGDLKTRPDYAVSRDGLLVGFVELKAPGKGADPRRFRDAHDREQWERLVSLPNLLYSDGNSFSLWQDGELASRVIVLDGDVATSGARLQAPPELLHVFESFFAWEPLAPRDAQQLARLAARLCRLLRDEVTEQLGLGSRALTELAREWRALLFPEAADAQFADGYAQAVTFGLLMARARGIELCGGLDQAARQLERVSSLIGRALRILTDAAEGEGVLKTSIGTLTRVLDAVHWDAIAKGRPETWLYFYEDFLAVYDNELRKQTGSYYTPPEVVELMVRLVDEALRTRFEQPAGLASPQVTLADPAVGTGTFLLGALRRMAESVEADAGPGAVPAVVEAALARLVAFELQLGPFAVAQLRVLAEVHDLLGRAPRAPLRMFVTDTLGNPYLEQERLGQIYEPIAQSRREANEIKKHQPIMVVIGNPPYKEKAKDRGGWVEKGSPNSSDPAPLAAWQPPSEWGVSAHAKHLRNLYVYFWRWATWKVFDQDPRADTGIVCFITVAGFLNGPGFEKMRDYLRRTCDEVWVIDCSPEGHQPEVATRVFEDVQQPVCIVLASRAPDGRHHRPATVRFRALPAGLRRDKFAALERISLGGGGWAKCSSEWRAPFLPASTGAWASYPSLEECFVYNGSGVMPGRTWVIAPDAESLQRRWQTLVRARKDKERLFHPHLRGGGLGDKHSAKAAVRPLAGQAPRDQAVADDNGPCVPPVRYGYRSFDRQWIIPDSRLINQPNPDLWRTRSRQQVYLTAFTRHSPTGGPSLTFTGLIPDLHHYKGSFGGRAFPLWLDRRATLPNLRPALLATLAKRYRREVTAPALLAYIAAVTAHPAFTARFRANLKLPGLRIPLTAKRTLFEEASDLGSRVIWLHTFGERYVDAEAARPRRSPRLPAARAPRIPADGAIPSSPEEMPDTLDYDPAQRRLLIGSGRIDNVPPAVWDYEVSGKQVLRHWFSYRRRQRARPLLGDRRPPSPLGDIQPEGWPAEYTSELLDLLHVLALLVELEPQQAALLDRICAAETLPLDELRAAGAFELPPGHPRSPGAAAGAMGDENGQTSLLD